MNAFPDNDFHPDPAVQAKVRSFPARLVIAKIGLFIMTVGSWVLLAALQHQELIGGCGTIALVAVSILALIGLCCYDGIPRLGCSHCHRRMKLERIPGLGSEEHLFLVCRSCRTYVDLDVSYE
jgi:hypothetical protein